MRGPEQVWRLNSRNGSLHPPVGRCQRELNSQAFQRVGRYGSLFPYDVRMCACARDATATLTRTHTCTKNKLPFFPFSDQAPIGFDLSYFFRSDRLTETLPCPPTSSHVKNGADHPAELNRICCRSRDSAKFAPAFPPAPSASASRRLQTLESRTTVAETAPRVSDSLERVFKNYRKRSLRVISKPSAQKREGSRVFARVYRICGMRERGKRIAVVRRHIRNSFTCAYRQNPLYYRAFLSSRRTCITFCCSNPRLNPRKTIANYRKKKTVPDWSGFLATRGLAKED